MCGPEVDVPDHAVPDKVGENETTLAKMAKGVDVVKDWFAKEMSNKGAECFSRNVAKE